MWFASEQSQRFQLQTGDLSTNLFNVFLQISDAAFSAVGFDQQAERLVQQFHLLLFDACIRSRLRNQIYLQQEQE